ncbi:MAG: GNAT family N-acetyltransferase [Hyphomonadaceae bacterium]|nr:GNAT family N-acetyltransferase [Hyphomonadaceae bacterium]GIK47397.1 MAG: N-acetyltransferase [Alphaproteobacteria bacterium]
MDGFRDNAAEHRYEFDAPEGVSFADYRDVEGVRVILHVETPEAARGKGYAQQLMDAVVEQARKDGQRLRASCAYAVAYFRRHPAAQDVLG